MTTLRSEPGCEDRLIEPPPTTVPKMVHSPQPTLQVVFYRTATGREPVREWLRGLDREARRTIGEDMKTVQFGWPLGMPLVRPLGDGLWEVRSRLRDGIARVIFLAEGDRMVLLHGFVKKSQKTPPKDLDLARRRAADVRRGG
jgi:phage-related protein